MLYLYQVEQKVLNPAELVSRPIKPFEKERRLDCVKIRRPWRRSPGNLKADESHRSLGKVPCQHRIANNLFLTRILSLVWNSRIPRIALGGSDPVSISHGEKRLVLLVTTKPILGRALTLIQLSRQPI